MQRIINFSGCEGTGSSSTFISISSLFSLYKTPHHNNVSQGSAKKTLSPPHFLLPVISRQLYGEALVVQRNPQKWETLVWLFHVAFLSKRAGFEPWLQGCDGNKKHTVHNMYSVLFISYYVTTQLTAKLRVHAGTFCVVTLRATVHTCSVQYCKYRAALLNTSSRTKPHKSFGKWSTAF